MSKIEREEIIVYHLFAANRVNWRNDVAEIVDEQILYNNKRTFKLEKIWKNQLSLEDTEGWRCKTVAKIREPILIYYDINIFPNIYGKDYIDAQ